MWRARIVHGPPGIARLNEKVTTVAVEPYPVQHEVLLSRVEIDLGVRCHEPVPIVSDKQIGRGKLEEPTLQSFTRAHP
jgi:hypothetical protein